MRGTRISVLAVLTLVAGLLGAPPASAADVLTGPRALFGPNGSGVPVRMDPITRTTAGVVWREPGDPYLWIETVDGYRRKAGFPDAQTAGDLLSHYFSSTRTFYYQNVTDGAAWTVVVPRSVPVPPDLTYLASTSTGYLAQRGTGPYELVSVDVLAGTDPVVFGTTTVTQSTLQTSPLGALATSDIAGQYVYFPYATPGAGQVLQTPADSTCTLTSTRLYCAWSDGTTKHLTRLPLTGGAGDQIDSNTLTVVEIPNGAAFTWTNGTTTGLSAWALSDPTPTTVLDGTFGITGSLAATTDAPSTVLVSHPGPFSGGGIYAVPVGGGTPTFVVQTYETELRKATDIAISPERVAWADNYNYNGAVWATDLQTAYGNVWLSELNATGSTLSIAAGRLSYTSGSDPFGPAMLRDGSTTRQLNSSGVLTQLSGDRALTQSRIVGPAAVTEPWALKDLRTGSSTALPDAVSYHLWGERLARLDADGSVWVIDLRTAAAPVQVRAPSDGVSDGTVFIAGDIVAWQVTSTAGQASTSEIMTRNLATMAPAAAVPGLSELSDLSTGYALGAVCPTNDSCHTAAVSLADGSATVVDAALSPGHRTAAVDGNNLAYISPSGIANVLPLPPYADQPRLLNAPAVSATVTATTPWTARILMSRVPDTCQIEIRNAAGALVRAVTCLDWWGYPLATTSATWDGTDAAGALVPDGSYTWRIVSETDGIPLADYDGSTSALSGAITVQPSVKAQSPSPNALTVSQTANITATFSAPVTGISGTTFVLKSPAGTTIPAVVSYNTATRTATLHPSAPLGADVRYTATLTGGATAIRGASGKPLTTQSWSFLTGPAPRLIAEAPVGGVGASVNTNITATFSGPVQGVSATTVALYDSRGPSIPATVSYNATTRVVTIHPTASLKPRWLYDVELTGGTTAIRDLGGNPMATTWWDFITGPGPTIIARTPGVNVHGALINGNITVTFNEPIMGVTQGNMTLRDSRSNSIPAIPAIVSYSAKWRTITINPVRPLSVNVRYMVSVSGDFVAPGLEEGVGPRIYDSAGNVLAPSWWYFTTGSR